MKEDVDVIMDLALDWLYCNNEETDTALRNAITDLVRERDELRIIRDLLKEKL